MAIAAVLLWAGCPAPAERRYRLRFEYPSHAVGASAISTAIILPPAREEAAVSHAIVGSLQELEHAIVRPPPSLGAPLPEHVDLFTDDVMLTDAMIDAYNAHVEASLQLARAHYRLRYQLQYAVEAKEIVLSIKSFLQRRGTVGAWHDYPRQYSGAFFADQLHRRIESRLRVERR